MNKTIKLNNAELPNKPSWKVKLRVHKSDLLDTLSTGEWKRFITISFGLNHFANTPSTTAEDGIKIMKGKVAPLNWLEFNYKTAISDAFNQMAA